jgi:hypothetical protein
MERLGINLNLEAKGCGYGGLLKIDFLETSILPRSVETSRIKPSLKAIRHFAFNNFSRRKSSSMLKSIK